MKKFKLARNIISLVLYSIGSVWNFLLWILSIGNYPRTDYSNHYTYGGDAYTGIQNAAADAANNIDSLAGYFAESFGAISTWIFLVLFIAFTILILKSIESIVELGKEGREERKKREAEFFERQYGYSSSNPQQNLNETKNYN